MAMIFLGGSRDIFELPVPAIERIASIVAAEHGVLIGDAPGADAEMQGLLAGYNYEHVGVFHAGAKPRNNLGDWAAYHIPPPDAAKGFAIHSEKDREMARRAAGHVSQRPAPRPARQPLRRLPHDAGQGGNRPQHVRLARHASQCRRGSAPQG